MPRADRADTTSTEPSLICTRPTTIIRKRDEPEKATTPTHSQTRRKAHERRTKQTPRTEKQTADGLGQLQLRKGNLRRKRLCNTTANLANKKKKHRRRRLSTLTLSSFLLLSLYTSGGTRDTETRRLFKAKEEKQAARAASNRRSRSRLPRTPRSLRPAGRSSWSGRTWSPA